MYEKRLKAVAPQAFTANGTSDGKVTVADASLFKVKQQVIITATGQDTLNIQINQIDDINTIWVGASKSAIKDRYDISTYTTALGAAIAADEQQRPQVPEQAVERATYEDEPVVARRVILVDKMGDKVDENNPLPVSAVFDGTVQVGDIRITAHDNDPAAGDIHSDVRINDGNFDLGINSDGSINVNVISSSSAAIPGLTLTHSEITSVPSGVETTISTITAPALGMRVEKIEVSGDNVALFRVKINGTIKSNKRIWHTHFNETFSYEPYDNGLFLTSGQVLTVTVIHNRPMLGSFETTVMTR